MRWRLAAAVVVAVAGQLAVRAGAGAEQPPRLAQEQKPPPPQQPAPQQPTFRSGVRTVPIYATVRDSSGSFVLDLTKDDFEVKDNGKVQALTVFTREVQPLTMVVLIDGSSSMMPVFTQMLDGVNQLIIRMLPGDQARIVSFADRTRMSPRFTANRDELLDYLRDEFNIRIGDQTKLWDAIGSSLDLLADRDGRRTVVVFSDGYDTASTVVASQDQSLASRYDAMIYAVAIWSLDDGRRQTRPSARLESLAQDSGGGFYELRQNDEMNSTFTQIAEELHNQYVLGFTPQALDGKVHRLEVKVKNSDMVVRSRKSYVATAEKAGK